MLRLLFPAVILLCILPYPVQARITRFEITSVESHAIPGAGIYQRLLGRAYGEVDPQHPLNAIIQDIELAPRNARGLVEYSTEVEILKPADMARGNGMLFFNVVNRGDRDGPPSFNTGLNGTETNWLTHPGDGFMMREGYTLIWFGWQADVLPGDQRLTLRAPIARNSDGSPIEGTVRMEIDVAEPVTTVALSTSYFTDVVHSSYPSVSRNNRMPLADGFVPSLTVRAHAEDVRQPVANTEWSFAECADGARPKSSETQICYPAGFRPGRLYELIYRARDPLVLGLGFAAMRDLGAFFKYERSGASNPVYRPGALALIEGSSQSGRAIRSFLHLGFNQDEDGRVVYDGALPHIAAGLLPLNVRFGQPGRGWGAELDHLYPAYDFPFNYATLRDSITGRTQGILDRCRASDTCPRIFHVATSLEIWEGRQSLGLTDALGSTDVPDPPNVRSYILASTQHGAAAMPLPAQPPFDYCQQQPNPNPQIWTLRALLVALTQWVRDDIEPPPSAIPRVADETLVPLDALRFPRIPANRYGGVSRPAVVLPRQTNPLSPLDFGPRYRAADSSGILTIEPPRIGAGNYRLLVPQVDGDGNDVAGIRSLQLRVPVGTYTGWNLFRAGHFEDALCSLTGSFIPFANTRAERLATGDPRLSLEERYPTPADYVNAMQREAGRLVEQRFLLPDDAKALLAAKPDAATQPLRIVAFGDSTTATAADWAPSITEVYAQCLPRTLAAHGIQAEAINAGIGDTTTREGRARLDKDVRSHAPDIVVIQFGINDSWIDVDVGRTEPRLTREEYRDNLRYFIRTLRQDGTKVILMTPNPMRWSDPFYIDAFRKNPGLLDTAQERGIDALLDLYAQDVRDVARDEDTAIVDVFAAFEDYGKQPGKSIDDLLLAGDGIHPDNEGQRMICELLTRRIVADDATR